QSAATLTSRTTTSTMQTSGMDMSTVNIYALTNDNTIYVVTNSSTGLQFKRLVRPAVSGNLVGLDFLASDGNSNIVYGLTDLGKLYKIDLSPTNLGAATLLSTLNPQFAGGDQMTMDFNPVAKALRLIGSNGQNFAVVSSNGGLLNTTAVQTPLSYATGDVNAGVQPSISCGAYTNNVAGAKNTIFYGIDYALDTFVTIAGPLTATGSSNTGNGVLQTIGPIV